jgi:hypothetical protein
VCGHRTPRTSCHLAPALRPHARFHDLGSDFYANHTNRERKVRNHISQLNALGYRVNLDPAT